MTKCKLHEGLRTGDLKDLILPLVSIDEFESKIGSDNDVIVVGFYASEEAPGEDLSRFIDRSVVDLYDTDVSPAPTEAGYFMVFVEFSRDDTFPKCLMEIIDEIKHLTMNDNWKMKVLNDDEIYDLTEDNIIKHVRLTDDIVENFEIKKFLNTAYLDGINIVDDKLVLEAKGTTHTFNIVNFGKEGLSESDIISCEFSDISKSNTISRLLGNGYFCNLTNSKKLIITNENSKYCLTLTQG